MNQNFVEVAVRAEIEAGELLGMLDNGEFLGSWEEAGILHIYWPEDKWSDAVLADLKAVLKSLEIGDADVSVHPVQDRDWNATWAASLKPIRLGRNIRIRQSWNPSDPSSDGIELVLDPKRAFGTGYHETTQLVIEWLEDHIEGGERILDIGTGSGILSMVAIRLGAASALGIDTDTVALDCARQYATENGFGKELVFRIASFESLGSDQYDVILANIDARTLVTLSGFLPGLLEEKGIACYSGLLQEDYDEVSRALSHAGLRITALSRRGEWLSLEVTALCKR
ncbi:MAG: 50S ribosomal protein L11 methyltransferase [Acidobacteriota bacterium]